MRFSDIPGLQSIKEKLYRTVTSSKVAHAQLFSGPEGSANFSMALAYAALLNCENRTEGDSCGACPSCQKISKLVHPDLHFTFPVSAAQKKTGKEVVSDSFIADWRKFVIQNPYGGPVEWSMAFGGEDKQLNISREESRNILKKLSLKSFEGGYKIMVIWLAEYLHPSAANALLKLLEEPPAETVFLLVTYYSEKIIGTVLSRVQQLRIRPFNNSEVSTFLIQHHQVEAGKASQLAGIASGNLNQAIKLINDVEDDTHDLFRNWMRICFTSDYTLMVEWAEKFSKANKISQKGLLQYGLFVCRESLLILNGAQYSESISEAESSFLNKFAATLNLNLLEKLNTLFNQTFYHLERNANPKILFLDASLLIATEFAKKARETSNKAD